MEAVMDDARRLDNVQLARVLFWSSITIRSTERQSWWAELEILTGVG